MCDCLPWHRCLMLHLQKHEMRSVYWASCGAQQTEYSEISFSFKPANAHSKQCSKGLRRDGSSIIPNLNRGKKRSASTMIASFTTAISLTVCLPACPTYLCLNLFYQFLSHSLFLLVIAHHLLIERKGACSVNNLTNL